MPFMQKNNKIANTSITVGIMNCNIATLDQAEACIQVMWSLSTNQRPVSKSCDYSRQIRIAILLLRHIRGGVQG